MNVSIGVAWAIGGMPPIAKPVTCRTNAAGALPSASLTCMPPRDSFTGLAPLVMTSTARSVCAVLNTSDFAICPTWQPTSLAASAAVRVGCSDSTTSEDRPRARSASWTFWALAVSGADTVATLCEPMAKIEREKIRLGVSACLLGARVRYDGGHKRAGALLRALGADVEWVPVCPEVELGLGVPRPPIVLVGFPSSLRLIEPESGPDLTGPMRRLAPARARQPARPGLDGFVLKSRSPSCGLRGVPVGARDGRRRRGRGLFAAELVRGARGLVIEEESRLADRRVRARFVARVWAAAQRRANAASAAASPERTQSAMPTPR